MVRVFILPSSSSWPRISASFLHTRVAAGRLLVVVVMGSSFWEDIFTTLLLLLYLLIQLLIASSSTCSTLIRLDTAENQTTPGAERNLTAKWDYTHKKMKKIKQRCRHIPVFSFSFVLATSHDNIFNKKLRRRR